MYLNIARVVAVVCVVGVARVFDPKVLWEYFKSRPWFQSAFFETFFTVFVYSVFMVTFLALSKWKWLCSRYGLHKGEQRDNDMEYTVPKLLVSLVEYVVPLAVLDSVFAKGYCGVGPTASSASLPVLWRDQAFPVDPPSLPQLLYQPLLALLLYDAVFYCVHRFVLHGGFWRVHRVHHSHAVLVASYTNRLAMLERLFIVLSANESLKLVCAHPLSRVLYIVIFIFLLVDSHSGFDFPFSYHRLVPFGWMGGSPAHYSHHCKNEAHYAPFFTHMDWIFGSKTS